MIGSTLITLLLTGSSRSSGSPVSSAVTSSAEVQRLNTEGKRLFQTADYSRARPLFLRAAALATQAGDERGAAMNWSNAGSCSLHTMQFRVALDELNRARHIAETSHQNRPLIFTLNNLSSLYIHIGQPAAAIAVAREALNGPAGNADADIRARLLCDLGSALMQSHAPGEALSCYREGINGLLDLSDLDGAERAWGMFGDDSLNAGNTADAERAYLEGLRLAKVHRLNASVNPLSGLARIKSLQGDRETAAMLFESALSAPPGSTPRWRIYAYRGRFRLDSGDTQGALSDFREARRIAVAMRADMVPADQDRVTLESGLSDVVEGLIDAGNRSALQGGDSGVLGETFDAAEQDRLWSLRALVPAPDDWRARLPEHYWELLARYQAMELAASTGNSPAVEKNIAAVRTELQEIEVGAARQSGNGSGTAESPLAHIRRMLDEDSVLLSFHVSKTSSWVWAVDRQNIRVFPLPPLESIRAEVTEFSRQVQSGSDSTPLGRQIYKDLFGSIPETVLRRANWRLELDGPLYELPFAALVSGEDRNGPVYLIERASIQAVPGALLLKNGAIPADGAFLAIGDPVYNLADTRYEGKRGSAELTLARLPNTAAELDACARAWKSPTQELLKGINATPAAVEAAIAKNPAIIHFATHVIRSPGDYQSGLIALSLDSSGAMGLLGPRDIVARPVASALVVMNGCHSAQGEALPSAGLMGLTRAWIGAGADAVLATQWDIPDSVGQSLMSSFYTSLKAQPARGLAGALRDAQLSALRNRQPEAGWAAYTLLSRIP
ncbi:MAG TPA: CHAT domain-containing protein [Bryobacteraceae bacterium]|nr:CHAT domain-containing protein [Bryobacteraceae bacterium]